MHMRRSEIRSEAIIKVAAPSARIVGRQAGIGRNVMHRALARIYAALLGLE